MNTNIFANKQNSLSLVKFDPLLGSIIAETDEACSYTPASQDKHSALLVCEGVIDIVAVLFNVSSKQIRSPKRSNQQVARIRQIGMYVAHVSLGINMRFIADGFARDKSTVVHACHLIEDLRDDLEFDSVVKRVEIIVSAAFRIPLTNSKGE